MILLLQTLWCETSLGWKVIHSKIIVPSGASQLTYVRTKQCFQELSHQRNEALLPQGFKLRILVHRYVNVNPPQIQPNGRDENLRGQHILHLEGRIIILIL